MWVCFLLFVINNVNLFKEKHFRTISDCFVRRESENLVKYFLDETHNSLFPIKISNKDTMSGHAALPIITSFTIFQSQIFNPLVLVCILCILYQNNF